jgi:hypothetical protein
MRNRQFELGKSVKLTRKKRATPTDFEALLKQAIQEGDEFTPSFFELKHRDRIAHQQELQQHYRKKTRRNHGAYMAVVGMFHFSLAQCILANKDEEYWLIRIALDFIVQAQNELMQAMLWLPESQRKVMHKVGCNSLLDTNDWQKQFQGIVASARLGHAAIKHGASIRMALSAHDLYRKIDFFCEPPIHGCPTLCVQIKSHPGFRGIQFIYLDRPPEKGLLSDSEYAMRLGVWRGVQNFNHAYKRKWVALVARIGILGVPKYKIQDNKVDADFRNFLNILTRESLSEAEVPFAQNKNAITACA